MAKIVMTAVTILFAPGADSLANRRQVLGPEGGEEGQIH